MPEAKIAELPEKVKPRKLPESRFRQAEAVRNMWSVVPEEGTTLADVLDPVYWSHNARKLRPCDIIEVMPDDGSYYGRLIVRSVGPAGVHVAKLEYVAFDAVEPQASAASLFTVAWKGPHHRWVVMRLADKEIIQANFENQTDAQRWLTENSRTLMSGKPKAEAA